VRGCCQRSSTCKYRHVSLDQYTTEVRRDALHTAALDSKRRRDDDDDDGMACWSCKTQDRLRVLQAENASLRKRVVDLRRKVALLSAQRQHRAAINSHSIPSD